MNADDLMMMALDAGAEDFSEEEDAFEIRLLPMISAQSARPWKKRAFRWLRPRSA